MENNKRFGGKLIPLSLITLICLAVLWQCSGETKTAQENGEEAAGEAMEVVDEAMENVEETMNEVSTEMEETASDGELSFEEGSWAWTIQDYLTTGTGSKSFTLDKVPYEGDEISAEGKAQLDNLAALLKAYPDMNVLVKGHSRLGDNAVEKTTNKATSKARALWVQAKLSNRGVSGKQMKAKGIGGDEPLADVDGKDMSQKRISIEFEK
ncbi:MAG: OmpA family protein [Bacteroidota bacterium]